MFRSAGGHRKSISDQNIGGKAKGSTAAEKREICPTAHVWSSDLIGFPNRIS